jgi:signal recognition particle subunit SRP54
MLDSKKIREAEERLKRNKAMICSMTKKERANPELLITDSTARSRLLRITRGSGSRLEDGLQFVSEFQRMRTMMSRMQKQMGGMDPNASGDSDQELMPAIGNRAMRRALKKGKKSGRKGGAGFG